MTIKHGTSSVDFQPPVRTMMPESRGRLAVQRVEHVHHVAVDGHADREGAARASSMALFAVSLSLPVRPTSRQLGSVLTGLEIEDAAWPLRSAVRSWTRAWRPNFCAAARWPRSGGCEVRPRPPVLLLQLTHPGPFYRRQDGIRLRTGPSPRGHPVPQGAS